MTKRARLKQSVKKSRTMRLAALFAILGVVELNFHLMHPFFSDKGFAVAMIIVSSVLAVARIYGLIKENNAY